MKSSRHGVTLDHAANGLAAADDVADVQLELRNADAQQRQRPARGKRFDRLVDDRSLGRGVDGVGGAAAGQLAHRTGHVVVARGRGRRRRRARVPARAVRRLDLRRRRVDADGDRGHHRREADRAGAEHDQRRVLAGPQHVEDGADAGLDATPERSGDLEIDAGIDRPRRWIRRRARARRSSTGRSRSRTPAASCAAHRHRPVRPRADAVHRPEVAAVGGMARGALGAGVAAAVAEHHVVAGASRR